MHTRFHFIAIALLSVACLWSILPGQALHAADEDASQISHVSPQQAKQLIAKEKLTIIDVRTDTEFAEGHLEGALNHDFIDDDFKQSLLKLDKQKPYLIHCESGARSTKALKAFKELGFTKIYHLNGGIRAWKSEGLPVTR